MSKTTIITLANMILPALLFFAIYKIWGILPAVAVSLFYCITNTVVSAVRSEVKNSQIIGLIGLIGSAVAICFTGEEKYYYVPALLENIAFLGFMIYLCIRRKSIFHFILKDFEIESIRSVPEERLMNVNILWLLFFFLKIVSKVVSILYLSFNQSFWLIFVLGDPMTIVVVVISVIMIRRSMVSLKQGVRSQNTTTDETSSV